MGGEPAIGLDRNGPRTLLGGIRSGTPQGRGTSARGCEARRGSVPPGERRGWRWWSTTRSVPTCSRASTPSPRWRTAPRWRDLSGGLTNRNLRVSTPHGDYVARLSSPESALLAIDRTNEHANSVAAAASGAAPDVIAYAPEVSVLVVRLRRRRHVDQRRRADSGERPAHRRRLPAAARRAAVRERLRHAATCSRTTCRSCRSAGCASRTATSSSRAHVARHRRGPRRAPGAHGAVQQRPARGQLHRRRPHLAHRLRVLRQQRPVLRDRQRVERGVRHPRRPRAAGRRRTSDTPRRPSPHGPACGA